MNQAISKRVKKIISRHFPGHILTMLFLWVILDSWAWIISLFIYLGLMVAAFFREVFFAWRTNRQMIYSKQVARLMTLIHDLIDLAFVYDENRGAFYKKFVEMVNILSLRRRGIINPDTLLYTPKFNRMCLGLRREDAELWALLMANFSNRELKIVYGMKNLNSVYIKKHRLRCRLNNNMRQLLDAKNI